MHDKNICLTPLPIEHQNGICRLCHIAIVAGSAIQLDCGHVFHLRCTKKVIEEKWKGFAISFSFCKCPVCKIDISHDILYDILRPIRKLKIEVIWKISKLLALSGISVQELLDNDNLLESALKIHTFFECQECHTAFHYDIQFLTMNPDFDPNYILCRDCDSEDLDYIILDSRLYK